MLISMQIIEDSSKRFTGTISAFCRALTKTHRRVVSAVYYFRTKAWVTGQAAIPAYRAKAQAQHLEVRNSEWINDRLMIQYP